MTQEKWTTGPWMASGNGVAAQGRCDTYYGLVWGRIATVERLEEEDGEGRNWFAGGDEYANARLIAAAPEMYEALRLAQEAMDFMGDRLNAMDAVSSDDVDATAAAFEAVPAALAKARGEA